MKRHTGKKAHKVRHPKEHSRAQAKPKTWRGFDNTRDIDLILAKRKLFQDVLGMSGERLGRLFETSVELLHQHRYDEAVKAFELLTQINPFVADFWIGLGVAHQAHETLKPALSCFLMAQTMDPARADPYHYAVECCLEMKNLPQAEAVLHQAITYVKKHSRKEELKGLAREIQAIQEKIEWEKEKTHAPAM